MSSPQGFSRRNFLKVGSVGAAGVALAGIPGTALARNGQGPPFETPPRRGNERSMTNQPFEGFDQVRIGLTGLGNRGMGMLNRWLAIDGAVVTAVHDIREDRAQQAAATVEEAGQDAPAVYTGEDDFEELSARDDVDFVYIATPWEYHYPQAKAALQNGCHAGVELPIAYDLRDIWDLVRTSERTGKHCMLMENVCYFQHELRLLNMAKAGLFGELLNGSGGYVHDLRDLNMLGHYYPEEWRRLHYTRRNEAHYPMHGFAPIAACMDINRGDRLDTIVSMASPALSMAEYREENLAPDHDSWDEEYISGDRNTALVSTVKGRIIRSEYSVMGPTPYSRENYLQGTRGAYTDDPHRVYFEPDHTNHQWRDMDDYTEYEHWLWEDIGHSAEEHGGHGGGDYIMQWRTIQLMRLGLVPDIDVYDSAAWCSVIPLSGESIKRGNQPVKVPDFTRGNWEEPREGLERGRPEGYEARLGARAAV